MEESSSTRNAWQRVGYRKSKAGGGTTNQPLSYRFTDWDLAYPADTVSYWLRQIDTDGSATLMDPITVGRSGPGELELLGTAPNPARQQVSVRYGIPKVTARTGGEVQMRLYDVLGWQVPLVEVTAEPGRHKRQLSVGAPASGVYILGLSGGERSVTQKLTVVH